MLGKLVVAVNTEGHLIQVLNKRIVTDGGYYKYQVRKQGTEKS